MHNSETDFTSVLQNITSIMTNTSLSEQFYESVLKRLDSLGYTFEVEHDGWMISFAIHKVEAKIKNDCNVPEIPEGLIPCAVDMVCGEFLLDKKQTGQLNLEGLDLDGAISSIREGDTTVNFDTSATDEQKFNNFIAHLMDGKGDFVCYRKMRW